MRLLMVTSAGGHLAQALSLRSWWQHHERLWITFDTPDAASMLQGEDVRYGYSPTTRNIPNLLRNTRMAREVLASYQPDLIFSTGAGMAVPYFYLGRRQGAATAFLEVVDRVESPTLTGRMVYPVTDHFMVQWPQQQSFYPDASLVGLVL